MDKELKALQRELGKRGRGRGARYPGELRERVVRYAKRQHGAGESWKTIGKALGLSLETVRRWAVSSSEVSANPKRVVPVRVVESHARTGSSPISVTGFRIEGLSVAEAAALLRALG